MGQYILEVSRKTNKDAPLREVYPSEEEAKAALLDVTKQVADGKTIVVSKGGGIALPYSEFAGAQLLPVRMPGTMRRSI